MQEQFKRLGKNTLIVFIGNFGSKLISFLLLPFYTRWLSVEDYGVSDLVSSYASLTLVVISGCIMDAVFVFPKGVQRDIQRRYFSSALIFGFTAILISGMIFYTLKLSSIENTFIKYSMAIWSIMSTSMLQSITQQFARSIDKMFVFGTTGIVQTISIFTLSLIMIPPRGVEGYIISIAVANIITTLYTLTLSKGYQFISIAGISYDYLKKMLKYSVPLVPANIMFWLISTINRPILELYCGLNSIGLYAIAVKIVSVVGVVSTIILSSWQISVLEEYGKESYHTFYNRIIKIFTMLMVIAFFAISMAGPIILRIVSTEEYYQANSYIPMLLLGTIIATFSNLIAANFSAVKKSKYFFYSSMIAAITAIVLNMTLIPLIGMWGALVSYVASFAVMAISRIIYSWKYVKLDNIPLYILLMFLCVIYCILSYKYENSSTLIIYGCFMCIVISYNLVKPLMNYISYKNK